jgi:DNA-binding MarR family transcriptional regulator
MASRKIYPIDESIGHLINLTHRRLQPLLEHRIRSYGLSYGVWFFLRYLWEEDGISQRELADRVGTSEPTALAALRKLQAMGLVSLGDDLRDRRRWSVRLTAKSRALKARLLPSVKEINAVVLKGLTPREVDELRRMLKIIRRNAG